jgi:sugar lactone lactonase YvrE
METRWNYGHYGSHGPGNELNQHTLPCDLLIYDDPTIYVADTENHRIVEWKKNAINGQIVVDENDQLNYPTTVIVDQKNDSFIICDLGNRRVVRWPRQNDRTGEILISNILCARFIMDNDGYLYVSDHERHQVRR